ncbi:MAG: hypothetical protein OXI59_12155, partial [Gemmatimonadota bacterium]|nr:hypothetical protein [Gemmatimonadota bacterium]
LADVATSENPDPEREIKSVRQDMQPDHPAYIFDDGALGPAPERQYSWYVRVPDIAKFLRKFSIVLERRIAESLHVGYTGNVEIRVDRDRIDIAFEDGSVTDVGHKDAVHLETSGSGWRTATCRFPGKTFLPILFGMLSVDETLESYPDSNTGSKSDRHLIKTLFPKRSSDISLTLL